MNKKAKAIARHYEDILKNYKPQHRERPIEYLYLFSHLAKMPVDSILDVGPGMTSTPKTIAECGFDVTAIDTQPYKEYWDVIEDDITDTKLSPDVVRFDLINCISVLEHIPNWQKAVENMVSLLRPEGYLLLTFPYNEDISHPNIYKHKLAGYGKTAKFICKVFNREDINKIPATLIDQEYWQIFEGEMWTFGKRLIPPQKVKAEERHQLTCLLYQKGAD